MKFYQYKFVWGRLDHYCTREVNNVFSNYYGVYFVFGEKSDLIKNIGCLNYLCLSDGFYSLYELGEDELKKLEDNLGERFR